MAKITDSRDSGKRSWRDVLPVHPAADLFPMMSPDELKVLGEDIKKNGLHNLVTLWSDGTCTPLFLLDGRNRLDAMEAVGIPIRRFKHKRCPEDQFDTLQYQLNVDGQDEWWNASEDFGDVYDRPRCEDPYEYVISANIQRRHLTAEQRRELIAKVLKAKPEQSNRQIAEDTKADHKTVGAVRTEMEGRGEIPHVETHTDTKGRRQPAKKKRRTLDEFEADKRARGKAAAAPEDMPTEEPAFEPVPDEVGLRKLIYRQLVEAIGMILHRHNPSHDLVRSVVEEVLSKHKELRGTAS